MGESKRRALAILYITATLLTAAACMALIVDCMWEVQQAVEGNEAHAAGIGGIFAGMLFPPLFAAEWVLWRAAVYFFCVPERPRRKTLFYSLYAALSLCIAAFGISTQFDLFASDEMVILFNWGLLILCVVLKGVEVLIGREKG